MIKNIFFDLDGTLVNTVGDLTVATNTMRKHFRLEPVYEDVLASIIGKGYPTTVRKILALDFNDNDYIESIADIGVKIVSQTYKTLNSANSRVYPHVIETLDFLKQQGIKMAVVTNKHEDDAIQSLTHLDLIGYFEVIVGGDTTTSYKPYSEPLLFAMNKLNAKAEESLIVGDSMNDYLCAKEANVKTIMVSYGYHNGIDLEALDSFAYIDDFAAIKNLVKEINPH
ncbi:HAD-IA family hydrolase [Francisella orientalis]|uniref:phosphoglycolate phosphatase n=1 Tax=Francisella orientalis TaxID=299583 RepID=A0AAP7FST1_9GAMM|nr:HAD-IA family hydrolase [Francisella orientalis]AFJ43590.1 phosphoglycolate phosphatase [Francisella orientalis str. Toba 04]AHB98163.1 phosphoglycolate phosphatase [Francisella orientalis LADL 07-285A]AKN85304.1 Phosphoglycolate phosphatase [Francisella orientalis FNO12]AKN86843.1 Phosphoglycolate phosphatase [Francisella orientalis FNO24]AKN88382.1 Phosphoglycolate phosphatase [Francisella orientalis]